MNDSETRDVTRFESRAGAAEGTRTERGRVHVPELVGTSPVMRQLAETITRIAALEAPVLIFGESGTGKDVVARALHRLSGRAGRYVPLNAGALGDTLADSELFGHCRGAFTGAVQARIGAFELADRGTLFLDEVAEVSPAVQVKLLRAVEAGEIRPLGATHSKRVQTRIVTASWAALEERVLDGKFRSDLYHRISTLVVEIPPLRERRGDIPELARLVLERRSAELGARTLSDSAIERLKEYRFPGNVRELFSIVYRAAALTNHNRLDADDIQRALPRLGLARAVPSARDAQALLRANHGNVSAAARSARVPRSTFRSWLKRARQQVTLAAGNGPELQNGMVTQTA
jgi:transcriptional regulator with GAF, ATPase, and Fis domain